MPWPARSSVPRPITKPIIASLPFHCSAKDEKPNLDSLIWVENFKVSQVCCAPCGLGMSLSCYFNRRCPLVCSSRERSASNGCQRNSALAVQAISNIPGFHSNGFFGEIMDDPLNLSDIAVFQLRSWNSSKISLIYPTFVTVYSAILNY